MQSFRDRGLSPRQRWKRRLCSEAGYWARVIRAPEELHERLGRRLDPEAEIHQRELRLALGRLARDNVAILDVGSGPLTDVGTKYPGKAIRVVAVDPLADVYNAELRRANVFPPVVTQNYAVDDLVGAFGPRSFEITYSQNAIDHMPDPLTAIGVMLELTAAGGFVVLRCMRNEGERNAYFGIHQWNIDHEDGDVIVWNKTSRTSLRRHMGERATFVCVEGRGEWVTAILQPSSLHISAVDGLG